MNKQELIYFCNVLKENKSRFINCIDVDRIIDAIKQLDEPQPVKVPQFVADWIERSKQEKRNLRNALNNGGEKMRLWFLDQENYDLFARAWLDGYEVEEKKRYFVKMKGIDINFNFLNRHRNENYWIFSNKDKNTLYQTHHTRKELEEAGFGWVFDCPGIEIEEVE